jgi:hypothetical protein
MGGQDVSVRGPGMERWAKRRNIVHDIEKLALDVS